MMAYCEDYPCCGHTPLDPCERQPYDDVDYSARESDDWYDDDDDWYDDDQVTW